MVGRYNGLNFWLESQARGYPKHFMRVLRARWIGSILGHNAPNFRVFGTGGYWFAIADSEERQIVASDKPIRLAPSGARLAKLRGPTLAQALAGERVPASELKITDASDGVITIPAACYVGHPQPTRQFVFRFRRVGGHVSGITPSKSFSGGMQIYYHCGQPANKENYSFQYMVTVQGERILGSGGDKA